MILRFSVRFCFTTKLVHFTITFSLNHYNRYSNCDNNNDNDYADYKPDPPRFNTFIYVIITNTCIIFYCVRTWTTL